jgi:hypothetical protein
MRPRSPKITTPAVPAAVPRRRLWSLLDAVKRRGGAIWIAGAPGSGKTTLVASWLAARRHPSSWLRVDAADEDLATFFHFLAAAVRSSSPRRTRLPSLAPGLDPEVFARRFIRAALGGLRKGTVLVLDDLGEVDGGSALHQVLRVLLEELPRGSTVVLASRGEPPPPLVRAIAGRALRVLGGRDLELTPVEGWTLARRQGFRGSRAEARELLRSVNGWAAGLALLLAHERGRGTHGAATLDYFTGEVFEREDPETRRVLLEAALLDAPSGSVAARATGNPAAPRLLASLARRGLFTLRHGTEDPSYQFHALFREFLLRRGREELPTGRAAEVRRAAAGALAERGGADAEAAFALLADAAAFEEAAALAVRLAPQLLAEGRAAVVEAWLARLPAALREADPWLLYFGAVSTMGREPEPARERLDRATALFAARGDAAGVWLAWAAAVEAVVLAGTDLTVLSARIDGLEALEVRFPVPSAEIGVRVTLAKLLALVQHAPGHPALRAASAAARALALAPGDSRIRLTAGAGYNAHVGWWLGDAEDIRPLVEVLGPLARRPDADPVAATFWLAVEAPYHLLAGDDAAAARAADEARELSHRLGVRAWDAALVTQAVWGALVRDDVAAARDAIGRLGAVGRPDNPTDLGMLRSFQAVVAQRDGAYAEAIRFAEEAKALCERVGYPSVHVFADLILARTYARSGRPGAEAAADGACASVRRKLGTLRSPSAEHVLALIEADRALRAGRGEDARGALERAAGTARAGAVHARYLFSGGELASLWAAALRSGVAAEDVRALVRARGFRPPPEAGEEWPWPLRIRALGRFEVERAGEVVVSTAHASRKALDLLRFLVAQGGRAVEQGVAADALWPAAEADSALHALETTLYRLRRIVGPDVVVLRDRRISLARDRCWVDAYELEDRLAAQGGPGAAEAAPELAGRIAAIYRGPLLAEVRDEPWAAAARDRLRRKLARFIDATARTRPAPEAAELRSRLGEADPALAAGPVLRLARGGARLV